MGIRRVRMKRVIRPLYFVPAARPQKIPAEIREWSENPCSIHSKRKRSDAVEKKIRPRST